MLLQPRYDGPPVLRFDGVDDDPVGPLVRQRERLATELARLDESTWVSPSRCEGWSVQDVVLHLITTNQFWAFSFAAGLAGDPTRFLSTFDPVASPAELVRAAPQEPPAQVLARFVATNDELAAILAGIGGEQWELLGEAPVGHVSLREVALHALWDSWIHERDVLLPLGRTPVEDADELAACLRYSAALGPSMAATLGSTRRGTLGVEATDPAIAFHVEVGPQVVLRAGPAPAGAPVLRGRAADLVEILSYRLEAVPDLPEPDRWMLGGLDRIFDRA
jgi:uncharacterized protein (TIGR03083 family)